MTKKQKNEVEIELDDAFNDFLGENDDNLNREKSNKVSFKLDSNGNLIDEGDIPEEIEIEDEFSDDDEEEDNDEKGKINEEDLSPPSLKQETIEKDKNKEERQRKSRAQERIKELDRALKQERLKTAALEQRIVDTDNTYAQLELQRLQERIPQLQQELKDASENGDSDKLAKITSDLIETQSNLQALSKLVVSPNEGKKSTLPKESHNSANESEGFSPAAENWMLGKEFILDNEEYRQLPAEYRKKLYPVRQAMATIARELLSEGFSNNDDIFYEEMDLRLSGKFDFYEALAMEGIDALQYSSKESLNKKDSASGETEKPQQQQSKKVVINSSSDEKAKKVPAKGVSQYGGDSSSSSQSSSPSSRNNKKVSIDKDMHRYWKNHLEPHGITLQEYAWQIMQDQKRTKF